MERILKTSKFIKKSQSNLEAWKAVIAKVDANELPPGLVDENLVNESVEKAKILYDKSKEAKEKTDALSQEDLQNMVNMVQDPNVVNAINALQQNKITASEAFDVLFIKTASIYFGEKESSNMLKEINSYKEKEKERYKIASYNKIEKVILDRKMILDEILSKRDGNGITKNAQAASLWQRFTNNYIVKLFGTVLPFISFIWAAHSLYETWTLLKKSIEFVKSHYSEFAEETSGDILEADIISGLIKKHSDEPEKLIRLAELNCVGTFYQQNWYAEIYEFMWLVMEFLASIAIIVFAIASGGVGGISTVILAEMEVVLSSLFGKTFTSIFYGIGTTMFAAQMTQLVTGLGTGNYQINRASIRSIAEVTIKRLESSSYETNPVIPQYPVTNQTPTGGSNIKLMEDFSPESINAFNHLVAST